MLTTAHGCAIMVITVERGLHMATVEGKQVKVGDTVGFKCDIEQYGVITKIKKDWNGYTLVLESPYDEGFQGGYIGGQYTHEERAEDCWVD